MQDLLSEQTGNLQKEADKVNIVLRACPGFHTHHTINNVMKNKESFKIEASCFLALQNLQSLYIITFLSTPDKTL